MPTRSKNVTSRRLTEIAKLEKELVPLNSTPNSLDVNSALQLAYDFESKFLMTNGKVKDEYFANIDDAIYYYYIAHVGGNAHALEKIDKLIKLDINKTLNEVFLEDRTKVETCYFDLLDKKKFSDTLLFLENYFVETYRIDIYKDDPSPRSDYSSNEFDVIYIPSVLTYFYYQCAKQKFLGKDDYFPFTEQLSFEKRNDLGYCSAYYIDICDILNLMMCDELQADALDLKVMPGMPAAAAYKIGLAYYFGTDLPHDIDKAGRWLSYAAMVGHPGAIYARQLFILDVAASAEEWNAAFAVPLFQAFKLAYNRESGLSNIRFDYLYENDVENGTLASDLLYNLLITHINSLRLGYIQIDDLIAFLLSPQITEIIFSDIALMKVLLARILLIDNEEIKSYVLQNLDKDSNSPQILFDIAIDLLKDAYEKHHCAEALEFLADLLISNKFDLKNEPLIEKAIEERAGADLAFKLGSYFWNGIDGKQDLQNSEKWWKKAAELGSSLALFNLSISDLDNQDLKSAVKHAVRAVNSGMILGFYVLYKALFESHPELAHTYLRYGAEYELPTCVKEYEQLKKQRKFKPLKFIKIIDNIEKLTTKDASACLFMQRLYTNGTLLPRDLFKAEKYYRRGLSFSMSMTHFCLDFILEDRSKFKNDTYVYRSFYPFNKSHRFLVNYAKRSTLKVTSSKELLDLVQQLYEALANGKHILEIDAFLGSIQDDLFTKYNIEPKNEDFKFSQEQDVISASDTFLKDAANRLFSQTFRLGTINAPSKESQLSYLAMLSILNKEDDRHPLCEYIKGMLALRPMACLPDLDRAFWHLKCAANGGQEAAILLSALSFKMFKYHLENKFTNLHLESTINGFINTGVTQ